MESRAHASATDEPMDSKTNFGAKMAQTIKCLLCKAAQSVEKVTVMARKRDIFSAKRVEVASVDSLWAEIALAKIGMDAATMISQLHVSNPRRNPMM